jgi:hypothetical protein
MFLAHKTASRWHTKPQYGRLGSYDCPIYRIWQPILAPAAKNGKEMKKLLTIPASSEGPKRVFVDLAKILPIFFTHFCLPAVIIL